MFDKCLMNISEVVTYDYYLREFAQLIPYQRLPYVEVRAAMPGGYSNVFAYAELEHVFISGGCENSELISSYIECHTNPTSNSLNFKVKLSSVLVYKRGTFLIKIHCYKDGNLIGSKQGIFQVV